MIRYLVLAVFGLVSFQRLSLLYYPLYLLTSSLHRLQVTCLYPDNGPASPLHCVGIIIIIIIICHYYYHTELQGSRQV